jgi:flagellar biosynthesis/type III secretory pathway protein FliH
MPPKKRWKSRTPAETAAAEAAEADITKLRKALDDAEDKVRKARTALAEGIAKHVEEGSVTQAEAGRAAGYEARTVNRLVREAGVPYVRPPKETVSDTD